MRVLEEELAIGNDGPPTADPTVSSGRVWWRPIAFLTGLALLIGGLHTIGSKFYQTRTLRKDSGRMEALPEKRAIVLGSSHGYGIDLGAAGLDGTNLSHAGQDMFEMAYIARAAVSRAPQLETVIVTVSYFTIASDNAAYRASRVQTRIGRRVEMYSAFPRLAFVPGDGDSYLKGLFYALVTRDHFRQVLWPKVAADADDEDDLGEPIAREPPPRARKARRVKSPRELRAHARGRCRRYDALIANMRKNRPDVERAAIAELRELALELEAGGLRVVLVTPPYYAAYNRCFDRRLQRLTRSEARRIARETGAEYLDASELEEFANDNTIFNDSDHLSKLGSQTFSRWLGERLVE